MISKNYSSNICIKGLVIAQTGFSKDRSLNLVRRIADEAQRKYSTMLEFSSDGGKSFHVSKSTSYCLKCGDRVLCCSHKPLAILPIEIPSGVTHIRPQRPGLKIQTKITSSKFAESLPFFLVDDESETDDIEEEQLNTSKVFVSIWKTFYNDYKGKKSKLPRHLPLSKILNWIQEVYDAKWEDEKETEKGTEIGVINQFTSFLCIFSGNIYGTRRNYKSHF